MSFKDKVNAHGLEYHERFIRLGNDPPSCQTLFGTILVIDFQTLVQERPPSI